MAAKTFVSLRLVVAACCGVGWAVQRGGLHSSILKGPVLGRRGGEALRGEISSYERLVVCHTRAHTADTTTLDRLLIAGRLDFVNG